MLKLIRWRDVFRLGYLGTSHRVMGLSLTLTDRKEYGVDLRPESQSIWTRSMPCMYAWPPALYRECIHPDL